MRGDLEDVKRELQLLLGSLVFTSALAAVDAEKASTRATPGPTVVYPSEVLTPSAQGYPVCELAGMRTAYASTDEQVKSAAHEVDIIWTQVGDDELVITQDLQRLVRATRDVLWPGSQPITFPGANSGPVVYVSDEYSQVMPARDHPFCKGAVVKVIVPTLSL